MLFEKWFDLQMFAEDPAQDPGEPNNEPQQAPAGQQQGDPDKKYSDEDVDKIVNKKFAKWQEQQKKAIEEAKAEAVKLAKMNAEQKQQYELEKLQKENEELKLAAVKHELAKTASHLLHENGIEADEDVLAMVVGGDAERTKANIEAFTKVVEAQVKKAELARATGKTPKTYANNGNTMTDLEKEIKQRMEKYK